MADEIPKRYCIIQSHNVEDNVKNAGNNLVATKWS